MEQYLLKFFENEQFQNDFLNGKLYMNTLKYFKENENLDIARADKLETIKEHKKQTPDAIQIGKLLLTKENEEITDGKITTLSKKFDYCNVLCLYSLWKNIENEQLVIDKRNKIFGVYCTVITDIEEFLNRVVKAVEKESYIYRIQNVNYINKNLEYKIDDQEIPFTKFDIFSYQKEFRITIDTKRNKNEPYKLEIGDLRDIAIETTFDKIVISPPI